MFERLILCCSFRSHCYEISLASRYPFSRHGYMQAFAPPYPGHISGIILPGFSCNCRSIIVNSRFTICVKRSRPLGSELTVHVLATSLPINSMTSASDTIKSSFERPISSGTFKPFFPIHRNPILYIEVHASKFGE